MIEAAKRRRRNGALLVAASATLWSLGGVGVKTAAAEPLVIAGLRSLFALVFIGAVLVVRLRRAGAGGAAIAALVRRPLVWGAAASYALMVVMFCLATRRTTAANAIFLQYTGPVYVALLSGRLLGERPSRTDAVAVVASIAGMGLAFGGELGGGRTFGNVLALLSGFGFAGLPLLLRGEEQRRSDPFAPLVATCLGNALAFVVALPAIAMSPPRGGGTWIVLALLGMLQMGLPYVLFGIAVRRLRAIETSIIAMLEAVLSPIWVLLATGERPSLMAAAGGGLILSAVVFTAMPRRIGVSAGRGIRS